MVTTGQLWCISHCNHTPIAISNHHVFRGFPPTLNAKSVATDLRRSGFLISLTIIVAFCFGLFVLFSCHYICSSALASRSIGRIGPHVTADRSNTPEAFKLSQTWAIIILYALAIGVMLAVLGLLLPTLIEQTIRFFNYLPDFIEKVRGLATESYPAILAFIEEKFGADIFARIRVGLQQYRADHPVLRIRDIQPGQIHCQSIPSHRHRSGNHPHLLVLHARVNRDLSKDIHEQLSFLKDDFKRCGIPH